MSDSAKLDHESPELSEKEQQKAEERTAPRANVIHEAILREGEEELTRPTSALAWSALAAGLSMGFSMLAEAFLAARLPDAPWRPLISKFGYSVGFLIVILGRQQLFTENTLTSIIPLLHHRSLAVLGHVLRLWAVVLVANLVGTLLMAWLVARTDTFSAEIHAALAHISQEAVRPGFGAMLFKAIFAGWLIALMVWLLPLSEGSRPHIIIILTYLIGIGSLSHIIAGSTEVLYGVFGGHVGWGDYFARFLIPTLLGNIIGGVSLVAAINHAQVVSGKET
jgi:formate/nitrite transporter FocA (FNT family)